MESDKEISTPVPPVPPPAPPSTVTFPQARPMHGRTSGPTRKSSRGQWTHEEDEILRAAVQRFEGKHWKKIADCFKHKTDVQCLHRWQKVLNPNLIKGPWSKEEDEMINQLVKKYGPTKWSTIAKHLPGRIGKQCRERWHNHLNPAIKKEAWTQEEELVLIRAHELYGNKWAELSKYLPGRTDNSIKNHWHSAVKKKLDSYKASGLLAQFQGLPLVSHENRDGSFLREITEGEDISESSQVGCSQTQSGMSNAGGQTIEDFILSEESNQGKIQSSSPTASCSEQYYPSLDDITFTIPDMPCEFTCSSNYLGENCSKDNFGEVSLHMTSAVDVAENSCLPGNYYLAAQNHNSVPGPPQRSTEYSVVLEDGSQIILTQEEGCAIDERCSDMINKKVYKENTNFQSIYQFSECGLVLEASNNDNLPSIPPEVSGQDGLTTSDNKLFQLNDSRPNSNLPCCDPSDVVCTEQNLLGSSRSVPVNTFISETSDDQQTTPPRAEPTALPTCAQETGTLCYEPPRFPSLDIPFFSCDLAQSSTDAQQDFSPLGIRQFMMSSASSLTPFRLWDSLSLDESPDALLKSAAKTFAGTPSILKKRNRDLSSPLSPFSERQYDNKKGNNVNRSFLCTSKLTNEFSHLDVIFDEKLQCKESASLSSTPEEPSKALIEDKENVYPVVRGLWEDENHNQESEARTPAKDAHADSLESMEKGGTCDADSKTTPYEDCASGTPRGVLVERHLNDSEFVPPDEIRTSIRPSEVKSSIHTSNKSTISESPIGNAGIFVRPPSFDRIMLNNGSHVSSSGEPVSAVTTVMVDSLVNEVGIENLNFFGGTPFRRSMESPSAWKSPWYFSSLVSCPRFEPDITIEDIGIFMSPGEGSFDAIGLLKQINDQGADAYADAREVLGSETPDSILRQRCSRKLNLEGESSNVSDDRRGHLHVTPNVMTERRVLDFSECGGTPVKSKEKTKCGGGLSLSSPSLLKSFR